MKMDLESSTPLVVLSLFSASILAVLIYARGVTQRNRGKYFDSVSATFCQVIGGDGEGSHSVSATPSPRDNPEAVYLARDETDISSLSASWMGHADRGLKSLSPKCPSLLSTVFNSPVVSSRSQHTADWSAHHHVHKRSTSAKGGRVRRSHGEYRENAVERERRRPSSQASCRYYPRTRPIFSSSSNTSSSTNNVLTCKSHVTCPDGLDIHSVTDTFLTQCISNLGSISNTTIRHKQGRQRMRKDKHKERTTTLDVFESHPRGARRVQPNHAIATTISASGTRLDRFNEIDVCCLVAVTKDTGEDAAGIKQPAVSKSDFSLTQQGFEEMEHREEASSSSLLDKETIMMVVNTDDVTLHSSSLSTHDFVTCATRPDPSVSRTRSDPTLRTGKVRITDLDEEDEATERLMRRVGDRSRDDWSTVSSTGGTETSLVRAATRSVIADRVIGTSSSGAVGAGREDVDQEATVSERSFYTTTMTSPLVNPPLQPLNIEARNGGQTRI